MTPCRPGELHQFESTFSSFSVRISVVDIPTIGVTCTNCLSKGRCFPVGLTSQEFKEIDDLITTRRRVKRHESLFRNGDNFINLYAIRTGGFKTCIASDDGRDQVSGFQMTGEMLGFDGIVNDRHNCDAVPLEDSEVCALPFKRIAELSRRVNALQRHVHKMMSHEIVREHDVMLMLANMRAEERLATFLVSLVNRLQARGFTRSKLILRMTREEIGSYLGLNLETVSRTFSKFAVASMMDVRQRHIRILDTDALRQMVSQSEGALVNRGVH